MKTQIAETTTNRRRTIMHRLFRTGTFTVLLALAASLSAGNAYAFSFYTFDVPGTTPWTDTGVDISAGDEVAVSATGTVTYGPDAGQFADADGGNITSQLFFSDAVFTNTIIHSLIGKLGGSTTVGTGTPVPEGILGNGPGFVGTSYDKVMPLSGRLFLGYNDSIGLYGDNSGSFSVELSVTPVPEPCTLSLLSLGMLTLLMRLRPSKHRFRV